MHETTKLNFEPSFVLLASKMFEEKCNMNKQSKLIMCGSVGIINKRDQIFFNMVAPSAQGSDSEEFGYQRIRKWVLYKTINYWCKIRPATYAGCN